MIVEIGARTTVLLLLAAIICRAVLVIFMQFLQGSRIPERVPAIVAAAPVVAMLKAALAPFFSTAFDGQGRRL
jgi:hypothetical protein